MGRARPQDFLVLTAGYHIDRTRIVYAREAVRCEYLERGGWELLARIAGVMLDTLAGQAAAHFDVHEIDRIQVNWFQHIDDAGAL